jgi:hypothetical protein
MEADEHSLTIFPVQTRELVPTDKTNTTYMTYGTEAL